MLIDFLNDYYSADFEVIHDVAGNQHLVGHSVRYDCDLFVKIFTDREMFYAEQNVNQVYCPQIYLDSVIFENKYIVVLRDRTLADTDNQDFNEADAREYGRMLGEFHQKVTGNVLVADDTKTKLSDRILNTVASLKGSEYEQEVNDSLKLLEADLKRADEEYRQLPHVVLHGDFSLRNIKEYQGHNVLIDFEWSHVGVAYEDFLRCFFAEVKDPKLRTAFIEGYRSISEFEIPQYELQRVLMLLCALEICRFHVTHQREKFGEIPHQMLKTIAKGDAIVNLD